MALRTRPSTPAEGAPSDRGEGADPARRRRLEIGGGWGPFACLAARELEARVTGITLSAEQAVWAREGRSDRVEVRPVDDRALPAEGKTYHRPVSTEMLEAAGYRCLPGCFETVDRLLAPERIAVIPSITVRDERHERLLRRPDFILKFPLVSQPGYDERFVRLWDFYLSYCEGGFATRHLGDVQLVLTRSGNRALGPVPAYPDAV